MIEIASCISIFRGGVKFCQANFSFSFGCAACGAAPLDEHTRVLLGPVQFQVDRLVAQPQALDPRQEQHRSAEAEGIVSLWLFEFYRRIFFIPFIPAYPIPRFFLRLLARSPILGLYCTSSSRTASGCNHKLLRD